MRYEKTLHNILDYAILILVTVILSSCVIIPLVDKKIQKEAVRIEKYSDQMMQKIKWNGHTWVVLIAKDGVGLAHDPDCKCNKD